MDAPEPKPRRRPRVSLLSLLLLTALAAVSIFAATIWREVGPLRNEVVQLRAEAGHLSITDPDKIYAIGVECLDKDTWKWRVYLPAGRPYQLVTRLHTIAGREAGMGKAEWLKACGGSCSTPIEGGEFTITVALRPDPAPPGGPNPWNIRTSVAGGPGGVCGTLLAWLDDRRGWDIETDARANDGQVEFDAAAGLQLLTVRRADVVENGSGWTVHRPDRTKPSDGVGVWIVAP